jgi:uncharacterized protein YjbI with pentapeptide repeats
MREPKDVIIDGKTLEEILINHKHWIAQDCDSWRNMRADLSDADLSEVDLNRESLQYADLSGTNLIGAHLSGTNLTGADLSGANLDRADLSGANLRAAFLNGAFLNYADLLRADLFHARLCETNLFHADLTKADLRSADLTSAQLVYADLTKADLSGANLKHANLSNAVLNGAFLNWANLSDTLLDDVKGSLMEYRKGKILTQDIIGYKKCESNVIVTLLIPRGAIVFSINGYKCRTNRAKVIAIDGANRAYSTYKYMTYYVGDEFNIYDFDLQYNEECAPGIHFFMTRKDAENYY